MTRRDPLTVATRWALLLGAVWFLARPALADPPAHDVLECDPVCVVLYCVRRCERMTDAEASECREECERYVTDNGCWPCKEGER